MFELSSSLFVQLILLALYILDTVFASIMYFFVGVYFELACIQLLTYVLGCTLHITSFKTSYFVL